MTCRLIIDINKINLLPIKVNKMNYKKNSEALQWNSATKRSDSRESVRTTVTTSTVKSERVCLLILYYSLLVR